MTTITKERLEQIVHAAGLEPCDYEEVFDNITTGEIVKMARMLLAGMENEPDLLLNKFLSRLQQFLDEGDFVGDERGAISGAIDCGKEMLSNYAAPQLSGNSEHVSQSYKLSDGWVAVPIEPTEDMIINGFESEPDEHFSEPEEWEKYDAMSGCQQAAHRAKLCWAAMIAAAPEQE